MLFVRPFFGVVGRGRCGRGGAGGGVVGAGQEEVWVWGRGGERVQGRGGEGERGLVTPEAMPTGLVISFVFELPPV